MPNHVHISAASTLIFALQLIIVGFMFRLVEITWPDSKLAKALAFVH